MPILLLVNFALATYLTGVIWLVQLVHYPGFGLVGAADWPAFHRAHTARITPLVALPMVAELTLGAWLAWRGGYGGLGWGAYGFTLLTWAHTGLVAVPLHNLLEQRFDLARIRRLVQTNWVRTAAWTLRAIVLGGLLVAQLRA